MKKLFIILLISVLFLVGCSDSSENQVADTTTTTETIITNAIEDITEIAEETTAEEEESILNQILDEDKKVLKETVENLAFNHEDIYYTLAEENNCYIIVAFLSNTNDMDANIYKIVETPALFYNDYINANGLTFIFADEDGNQIANFLLFNLMDTGLKDHNGMIWKIDGYESRFEELELSSVLENFK